MKCSNLKTSMKKTLYTISIFLTSIFLACAGDGNDYRNYNDIPAVKILLGNQNRNGILKEIDSTDDTTAKFMIALNFILKYRNLENECKGSHFLNIAFTGHDGNLYSSGIAPEAISDKIDRKNYELQISENENNLLIVREVSAMRNELIEIARAELAKLDGSMREAAAGLFETVVK